jgi:heme/copper-type cytochrome/quinol oxidase subunit 2
MIASVRALSPEDFKAWYAKQGADIKASDDAAAVERKQEAAAAKGK